MKYNLYKQFAVLISIFFILNCFAKENNAYKSIYPKNPKLTSKCYLLIDANSNRILSKKNIDKKIEPASLTKIMTAYVLDQVLKSKKIRLNDLVLISKKAWRTKGSRMFLEPETKITIKELMKGLIIQSGNDASVAISEHIATSEKSFADIMNYYAKILGMFNTHFVNSTGIPNVNHYTTARDLAILSKYVIKDFPISYNLYSKKSYTFNKIKQINRNRLLWINNSVDGIKTGYTKAAGFCLVSSAKKNNMRLISILLGSNSDTTRTNESNILLNWGFNFFTTYKLYSGYKVFKHTDIYMGNKKSLPIGIKSDLYVTIKNNQYKKLKAIILLNKNIKAPVDIYQTVGFLNIKLNNKIISKRPIIALEKIDENSNFFSKISDFLRINLNQYFNLNF